MPGSFSFFPQINDGCMNHIYINSRFLSQNLTGVQRYAIEVVKALDHLIDCGVISAEKYSFHLLCPNIPLYDLALKHIPLMCVGKLTGHLWEQLELPFFSKNGLLLNLCNTGPLFKRRQIVTIHDASIYGFPTAYSWKFQLWYRFLYFGLARNSLAINTVSYFSREELSKYSVADASKINVIHEGKEHFDSVVSDNSIIAKYGLHQRLFVLAVSSLNPNKNFHSVVGALELVTESKFDLVIAGGTNSKIFSKSSFPLADRTINVGYVTDQELKALYEHSACFIYPSFYEGFGLPPLEAMSCGCPVIVSNAASMPEVCGDAVLYCDPYSPEDIAAKIRTVLADADLREKLRLKGLQRASLFSWVKCGREVMSVIEKVLSK